MSSAVFSRWTPLPNPGLKGPYAPNDTLTHARHLPLLPHGKGPEDVAVDPSGAVYVGLDTGVILRFPAGEDRPQVFCSSLKRPLGMQWSPRGGLYVCDVSLGLVKVHPDGTHEVLADACDGRRITFPNNLAVDRNDNVYFSDSSRQYAQPEYLKEVMTHDPGGRLLFWDSAARKISAVRNDLFFPNGVALNREEDAVVFAEMGKYRLLRLALRGPKAGQMEPFVENLPGFPDNLTADADGNYWVGMSSLRSPILDFALERPWLRQVLIRIPEVLLPKPKPYGFVLAFDSEGQLVYNLHDPTGKLGETTSACRVGQTLYVGSLNGESLGAWALPPGGP